MLVPKVWDLLSKPRPPFSSPITESDWISPPDFKCPRRRGVAASPRGQTAGVKKEGEMDMMDALTYWLIKVNFYQLIHSAEWCHEFEKEGHHHTKLDFAGFFVVRLLYLDMSATILTLEETSVTSQTEADMTFWDHGCKFNLFNPRTFRTFLKKKQMIIY